MTATSPMSVQGQPTVIVAAITQRPKAIIPAEINRESTVSMIGPLSSGRKVEPPVEELRGQRAPAAPLSVGRTRDGVQSGTTKANERNEPELRVCAHAGDLFEGMDVPFV
jgi:hypothetical protein